MTNATLSAISDTLVGCDMDGTLGLVKEAVEAGISAGKILDEALIPAIRRVGDLWEEGEFFLPELLLGAEIMQKSMEILEPLLTGTSEARQKLGKVVIGTVEGDIHDIGKSLVASMLGASGFEVIDLGADVPAQKFAESAREQNADLVCLSALLTTTMIRQRDVIQLLKEEGLRDSVKVMVGGAPVDEKWKTEIEADGWAEDAVKAVKAAKDLLGIEE